MRIHICVRATLDWGDEAAVEAQLIPEFRPKYDAWNRTFDVRYAAFRRRLTEIARENLARVEGAEVTPIEDVPTGDVVVPVDDDDWFAPHLAREIRRALTGGRVGCNWYRQVVSATRRRPKSPLLVRFRRKPLGGVRSCGTNNYAYVHAPDRLDLARHHRAASEWFDARPRETARIRKTLSIHNRNVASQTVLAFRRPSISRDELVEAFESYRDLYRPWPLGRALAWARPWMDRMAELMDDVSYRAR